jgi:hypothetical protein
VRMSTVVPSINQLRAFVLHDLEVIGRQQEGLNYAAVLVVASACDALGTLRYGKRHAGGRFFAEYMLPAEWQGVGLDLWNGLRNGLAHSYETKTIIQAGAPIELAVSWRDHEHLTFDPKAQRLFLNVQVLISSLRTAFDRCEEDLCNNPGAADAAELREGDLRVAVPTGRHDAWRAVLAPFGFAGEHAVQPTAARAMMGAAAADGWRYAHRRMAIMQSNNT